MASRATAADGRGFEVTEPLPRAALAPPPKATSVRRRAGHERPRVERVIPAPAAATLDYHAPDYNYEHRVPRTMERELLYKLLIVFGVILVIAAWVLLPMCEGPAHPHSEWHPPGPPVSLP